MSRDYCCLMVKRDMHFICETSTLTDLNTNAAKNKLDLPGGIWVIYVNTHTDL